MSKLVKEFNEIKFTYIGRDKNQFANVLATLAFMAKIYYGNRLQRLAIDYYLDAEVLYKRLSDGTLLRCLDGIEVKQALQEVYKGICAIHTSEHMMAR